MNPAFIHLKGDEDSGFQAQNTTTGACISFLANRGGNNGIYDEVDNKWYQRWSQTDGTGHVYGGDKSKMYTDDEGGNLDLKSPDGSLGMQADLYNNDCFRMYVYSVSPWKYLSDIYYHKTDDYWSLDSGVEAPYFSEDGTKLDDKYLQRNKHSVYCRMVFNEPGAANDLKGWNFGLEDDGFGINRMCIFDFVFSSIPAGGTVTLYIGAGRTTDWLYNNYNTANKYPYRKKITVSNDTNGINSLSASGCICIKSCTNLRIEVQASFAWGSGTSFSDTIYTLTFPDR